MSTISSLYLRIYLVSYIILIFFYSSISSSLFTSTFTSLSLFLSLFSSNSSSYPIVAVFVDVSVFVFGSVLTLTENIIFQYLSSCLYLLVLYLLQKFLFLHLFLSFVKNMILRIMYNVLITALFLPLCTLFVTYWCHIYSLFHLSNVIFFHFFFYFFNFVWKFYFNSLVSKQHSMKLLLGRLIDLENVLCPSQPGLVTVGL